MYDLVIKNGLLYDSASRSFSPGNLAVKDGKICRLGEITESGARVIDADGLYVVPGLIDMHCHIFPTFPRMDDCLPTIYPDVHMIASGVTCAVDAGTCGLEDFLTFEKQVIHRSRIRIFAFLNIADGGMVRLSSEQEPGEFLPEAVGALAKCKDSIVGIKSAHYRTQGPFDTWYGPWQSVDAALKAGEIAGKPVMVDFKPVFLERTYEALLKRLRRGDIHTHVYAGHFDILDENGKVREFVKEARRRGIVFDLGHGEGSFVLRHACPAYEDGFYPDTISTDLYMDNVNGPAFDLISLMSKYLAVGMPFGEVIWHATAKPAEVIGHPELGVLREGGTADIALIRKREGTFAFPDCEGRKVTGNTKLECCMTIKDGEILYNPEAMGLPDWKEEAGK